MFGYNEIMHTVKILLTEFVTHDVKRFIVEKPEGYSFTPGQATEVAINNDEWKDKKHPFTFTSLNEDKVLEFTIKTYPVKDNPNHSGMTEQLLSIRPGDELLLDDPWGTIEYKGTGVFIAGGAGITPFIAIIKDLHNQGKLTGNKLFFSNKESKDVIYETPFRGMFAPSDLVLTLTREETSGYEHGRIDEAFLKKHIDNFDQHFYVCGPKPFNAAVKETLASLGASSDSLVFEE